MENKKHFLIFSPEGEVLLPDTERQTWRCFIRPDFTGKELDSAIRAAKDEGYTCRVIKVVED